MCRSIAPDCPGGYGYRRRLPAQRVASDLRSELDRERYGAAAVSTATPALRQSFENRRQNVDRARPFDNRNRTEVPWTARTVEITTSNPNWQLPRNSYGFGVSTDSGEYSINKVSLLQ